LAPGAIVRFAEIVLHGCGRPRQGRVDGDVAWPHPRHSVLLCVRSTQQGIVRWCGHHAWTRGRGLATATLFLARSVRPSAGFLLHGTETCS